MCDINRISLVKLKFYISLIIILPYSTFRNGIACVEINTITIKILESVVFNPHLVYANSFGHIRK